MGIFVGKDSKVVVQGITGKQATFHTQIMKDYGTNVVAGVTPGRAGEEVLGIPVFNTVSDAVEATGANVSVIYVPARFAADSVIEAADAGVDLVVCITENIPVMDMIRVRRYLKDKKTKLIGPNCPGILTVDECRLGLLPTYIHKKGHVGVISRSGTLTYEVTYQLTMAGIGQTTCIGIGGDPVKGMDFIEVLKAFNEDEDTLAVMMIGEIGGTAEEEAAEWIKENMKKPVVGFISGQQAPPGKRMGHAGAIISGGKGTAKDKIKALNAAGIEVADTVASMGQLAVKVLKEHGIYDKCHTC
ncbi:succinate--CoA ligase subunit alpha [Schwartzia succinivorans]|jgi:succinyl-CoA synthetase alpha subunit|uniref:Succinate--CoA ligase [ADP-forming] subunit alpha n=1 Tax=Schwartzia succinivorans DSM 10502 TaxID=1123243 RepID=A0A1M4ZUF6_9FIRM|nr:succinate--CoA ligase subunit alpha [Schwartzia succinivorans]MBQ1469487.1 succinate--CoA ligase subunit alpha [Schwartzia sp. (in: firmicutes)]MBE6097985.1 succinate--CoA ligase subunit alpha [Schwartzia succinivorans]MBQ1918677.1 succinate--CoA ligase subunit alpha [Schwartzia sp. (in: firmicutes)]MBQ2047841.1 succinate--CoA ligase subunit alpha [Schwartzia sp. (in: firmicutes)]MBQ3863364.1 succinate--CoA ligase subunit alpha [Schwartzia sp. (in: firmicutes)]